MARFSLLEGTLYRFTRYFFAKISPASSAKTETANSSQVWESEVDSPFGEP